MATKIVTKNSSTAGSAPLASDLVQGELAVNVTDKRLYTENASGVIVEVGSNPYNFTANHDGSAKLATTATGIDVTGTATMDGLTVDGATILSNLDVDSTTPQIKLNETDVTDENTQFIQASGTLRIRTVTDAGALVAERLRIDHGTGDISFYEDTGTTAKLFWDASAESLGIGTSSPSDKLHVGASSGGTQLKIQSGSGVNNCVLHTNGTTDSWRTGMNLALTNGSYEFYDDVNNVDRMVIDSSGNVGIGTTSPSSFNYLSTSPHLVVGGGSSDAGVTFYSSTNGYGRLAFADGTDSTEQYRGLIQYYHGDNSMQFYTGSDERMRIDSSGNVGIGVTSPSSYYMDDLVVSAPNEGGITIASDSTSAGAYLAFADGTSGDAAYRGFVHYAHASDYLRFGTAATERMRIDSSGNLLVGGTLVGALDSCAIENYGGITISRTSGSGRTMMTFKNAAATVGIISTTTTSTTYGTSSDQRLKDNIVDAPSASDDIDAIQVRSFDWKADGSHQKYGMIAQELQTVAPEAVHQPEDSEEMMGVDYSKLVPMLIKEIQSLRNRVAQLEE
jgi:hypothetical protein